MNTQNRSELNDLWKQALAGNLKARAEWQVDEGGIWTWQSDGVHVHGDVSYWSGLNWKRCSGAYVYRAPFTARRQREERLRFESSKHLYQDRFCGLRLRGEQVSYKSHCQGEDCEHFAPPDLIQIKLHPDFGRNPLGQLLAHKVDSGNSQDISTGKEAPESHAPAQHVEQRVHTSISPQQPPAPISTGDLPLVSCIMPTYNRRAFVKRAISYFLHQDYAHKELIIVDDGTDSISDLVPLDGRIHYIRLPEKTTVGAKRNLACEHARGSIIVHWDDDDWYAPHRLHYQAEALLREGTDICGTTTLLYYDAQRGRAWQYVYPGAGQSWVAGGTLCYMRSFWASNRFAHVNVGEDNRFVRDVLSERVTKLPDARFYVGMVHSRNVSPKRTHESYWQPYPVDAIRQLMGTDWNLYHPHRSARRSG